MKQLSIVQASAVGWCWQYSWCSFRYSNCKVWVRDVDGWSGDPAAGTGEACIVNAHTPEMAVGMGMNYITGQYSIIRVNAGQDPLAYPVPTGFSILAE